MQFRSVRIRRDPACPMCATRTITELVDYDAFCGTPATAEDADPIGVVAPRELAARLARGEDLQLIDVREPHEWDAGHFAGARLQPLGAGGSGGRAGIVRRAARTTRPCSDVLGRET